MLRSFCWSLVVLACAGTTGGAAAEPAERPIDGRLIERAARRVEPDLVGRGDRLRQYLDGFRRELTDDRRLTLCEVTPELVDQGQVRLEGWVEYAETRAALSAFFAALGFEVDNQVRTLPDAALGDRRLGLVKTAHSLSLEEPRRRATVGTDCLLGEPLFLLREAGDYFLVHGGDGYLGYVPVGDVHRVTESELAEYLDGPMVQLLEDHELAEGIEAPAGARLKWLRTEGDQVIAQLPTGGECELPASVCEVHPVAHERIDCVVKSARALLETPYLWGGKTSAGVDCSGLVQVAFGSAGVRMPRDANQQFHVGRLVATRWATAGLRRGDTLYFIGPEGRIRHTGLYLGDDQFIHAISPVVTINSFNPDDENYDERRHASFAFARRLWD